MNQTLRKKILQKLDLLEESMGPDDQLGIHCVNYNRLVDKVITLFEEENRTIHASKKFYKRTMHCQLHGEPYELEGISVRLFLPVIHKEKIIDVAKHSTPEQIEDYLKQKFGKDKIINWHEDFEFLP